MATEAVVGIDRELSTNAEPRRHSVALLGFGTVGRAVAGILQKRRFSHLGVTHIFNRNVTQKKVGWLDGSICWSEDIDRVLTSNVDVVVEALGGVEPARTWVQAALEAGKSVVTSNKQLVARHGPELLAAAHRNGCRFLFGASVAGVVPVIAALEQGLSGDHIESISGILNGTCNYVLTQMEAGLSFAAAIKRAQELGYAEADPTDDVEGHDACAKLVILARVGLHRELALEEVACTAISRVQPIDFEYAHDLDCTIRQLSCAAAEHNEVFGVVAPMLVPRSSRLASAQGCQNVLVARGLFGGDTVFAGAGAGGDATAVAVISDLLSLTSGGAPSSQLMPLQPRSRIGDPQTAHYLRFVVRDRPGIVAGISGVLAQHGINVDAVLQKPGYNRNELPFVITVEACSGARLNAAIDEIAQFDFLVQRPLTLRIFAGA